MAIRMVSVKVYQQMTRLRSEVDLAEKIMQKFGHDTRNWKA